MDLKFLELSEKKTILVSHCSDLEGDGSISPLLHSSKIQNARAIREKVIKINWVPCYYFVVDFATSPTDTNLKLKVQTIFTNLKPEIPEANLETETFGRGKTKNVNNVGKVACMGEI